MRESWENFVLGFGTLKQKYLQDKTKQNKTFFKNYIWENNTLFKKKTSTPKTIKPLRASPINMLILYLLFCYGAILALFYSLTHIFLFQWYVLQLVTHII